VPRGQHQSKLDHPFAGLTVFFATKHGKTTILEPLLSELGIQCRTVEVDTDEFGTFSGEKERKGSILDTLRSKIDAAEQIFPDAQLILASEGSFAPHPQAFFLNSNLEVLLLRVVKQKIEIRADYLCQNPIAGEQILGPRDDFRTFLKEIGFPEHGVIVRPEKLFSPIFKGLHSEHAVAQAMLDSFTAGTTGRVVVSSDLRAMHNPTRVRAIGNAGRNLVEILKSLCPKCDFPGYAISQTLPGLRCSLCRSETRVTRAVVLQCPSCEFSEEQARPDGLKSVDPRHCEFCNP